MIETRAFAAYQDFIGTCRRFWGRDLLRAVRGQVEAGRAAGALPAGAGPAAIEAFLADDAAYQAYGWLEHNLQRAKLTGRWGVFPAIEADAARLNARLDRPLPQGMLTLDPDVPLPDYFTEHDIHVMPGGLWEHPLAGYVYQQSAGQTGGVVGKPGLPDRFAAHVMRLAGSPRRVADLGCGFGKSTAPFAKALPEAAVLGVDLSAACLRVAAQDAVDAGLTNIRYRQADATHVSESSGGFDLVTSTMVLHEMPPEAIRGLFAEAHRLLAPGGTMIHLDFLPGEDPFAQFIHFGHGRRNNEPFMEPMSHIDFAGLCGALGLVDVEIAPFEEETGALAVAGTQWRLPWVVIRARKPR